MCHLYAARRHAQPTSSRTTPARRTRLRDAPRLYIVLSAQAASATVRGFNILGGYYKAQAAGDAFSRTVAALKSNMN